jgi:hypothetical protein
MQRIFIPGSGARGNNNAAGNQGSRIKFQEIPTELTNRIDPTFQCLPAAAGKTESSIQEVL